MPKETLPENIIEILKSISNKRARIVIEHIIEHGFITTENLEKTYGYKHPPRAARDVREAGIPLETFRVQSTEGRWIAAYKFGDLTQVRGGRLAGRRTFPKKFKAELYKASKGKCAVCRGDFAARYLQIDHRVPYEVAGETPSAQLGMELYMLLCGSCNRAKSWSCEHCANWLNAKSLQVCSTCYWAVPDNYLHIALREIRRVDMLWDEDEVEIYEKLKQQSQKNAVPLPDYVKKIIAEHLERNEL